jgi:hypothetical protein
VIIIFEVTAILPVGPWSKEEGTKKEKKNYLKKHKSHLAFSVLVFLETLQKFPNILEHYLHIYLYVFLRKLNHLLGKDAHIC